MTKNKKKNYVGVSISTFACLGIIFGLLFEVNIALSMIIGANIGILFGAVNNNKNND